MLCFSQQVHVYPLPPHTDLTSHSPTHSWAQLDELDVCGLCKKTVQAVSRLLKKDAHIRERMLVAGVRVLVGGTAVVLSNAGGGRQVMQCMSQCSFNAAHLQATHLCPSNLTCCA